MLKVLETNESGLSKYKQLPDSQIHHWFESKNVENKIKFEPFFIHINQ